MAPKDTKTQSAETPKPPKGWSKVSADDCLNFFKPAPGAVITGTLLGLYERKGEQEGQYFQIKLTEECTSCVVPTGNGKDFEPGTCKAGDIVNLDYRASLDKLAQYATDTPGVYDIWVLCKDKIKIKGNRTFWKMDAFISETK